jgi:hypothetical protein
MRAQRIVLCCIVLSLAACGTQHRVQQISDHDVVIRVPETESESTDSALQRQCPNTDDGRVSAVECQQLIDSAQNIVDSLANFDATALDDAFISDWREREKAWKAKNDKLIANCELLLGADGTPVFPEIPLALQSLNRADERLVKSIDVVALSHRKKVRSYIKGARADVHRAMRLLDGV